MNWKQKREIALGLTLLLALTGCVGYVGGGYGGGGAVFVPGPEVTIFGGGFERGRDVRAYSHRAGRKSWRPTSLNPQLHSP